MNDHVFIECDAHEGCIWVPTHQRLYFSTTKKLEGKPHVELHYLNFSHLGNLEQDNWARTAGANEIKRAKVHTALPDANMTNSMCLTGDGTALLLAEQGDNVTPARITRFDLETGGRLTLVEEYQDKPLNSPNKVIRSKSGFVIFSDPDYGFRQGFRPPPALEPNLYVFSEQALTATSVKGAAPATAPTISLFRCNLEMPHGLALSEDEKLLYVTDTSADGAHDEVDLDRRRAVFRFDFDAKTGQISGPGTKGFSVDEGVPDGTITVGDLVLTGGGDGVYVADKLLRLKGKIKLDRTAVNLCAVGPNREHLFVTADEGVYLLRDWESLVKAV